MNFVAAAAVDERRARDIIASEFGYGAETFGPLIYVSTEVDNSRQKTFVFETVNDVRQHPTFTQARLSDRHPQALRHTGVEDGDLLERGPDVTVGG